MNPLERLHDAFEAARALAHTNATNVHLLTLPTGAWLYLADAIRDVLREGGAAL